MKKALIPLAAFSILAGFVIMRIGFLREPLMGVDPAIYMTVADGLSRGLRLYADIWDHKPPGIYLLYQLILAVRPTAQAAIMAGLAAMAVNLLLLYAVARRLLGAWAGLAAAWLLAVFTAAFWASAPNAEVFLLTLQLAALALWLWAPEDCPGTGRVFAAGVLFGVAGMIKYVAAAPAAAVALWLAGRAHRERRENPFRQMAVFAAGLAAGALPFALYCLWRGVWSEFVAGTLGYNAGYVFTGAWSLFRQYGRWFILEYLAQQWALWLLAGAGLALWLWRRRDRLRLRAADGSGLVLLWLAGSLVAAAAPLKFLDHYFLLAVPGLCFWAAYPLREGTPLGKAPRVVAALVLLAVSLPLAGIRTAESLERWRRLPPDPPGPSYEPAVVGRYLQAHTSADDRIYVWRSLDTDIYFYAHRRPASRYFFFPHLLREPLPPGVPGTVEADFRAHPPAFVVVGNSPVYADRTLPFLDRMLARDYVPAKVLDHHRIFRRRGPLDNPSGMDPNSSR
jgi:hypothetical protein